MKNFLVFTVILCSTLAINSNADESSILDIKENEKLIIIKRISDKILNGAESFFNVEYGKVEFGVHISSEVFWINSALNFSPNKCSLN